MALVFFSELFTDVFKNVFFEFMIFCQSKLKTCKKNASGYLFCWLYGLNFVFLMQV